MKGVRNNGLYVRAGRSWLGALLGDSGLAKTRDDRLQLLDEKSRLLY